MISLFKIGGHRSAGYYGALNSVILVFSLLFCPVFMVLGFVMLVVSNFGALVECVRGGFDFVSERCRSTVVSI